MARKKYTLFQRLRYRFDNVMTAGLLPMIILLFSFAFLLTLVFSAVIVSIHLHPDGDDAIDKSFWEAFWQTLMHVIDQGTITDKTGWSFRLVMLIPTFLGLFTVATLVAIISTTVNKLLEDLRKGRSIVVEQGHVVILGWSNKIFPIIRQLVKANANQSYSCIVVLAERDKVDMEDEIREKVPHRGNTRIICRTGNPIDLDDLEIVNPHDAKSIIIVSPDEGTSDAHNVKSILAITNHPNRKPDYYHIIAELNTDNNREIANLIGGDELTLVISSEIIARIAVQTCLQSGLSSVYNTIFDFSFVEIYFRSVPELYNHTYAQALSAYDHIAVIGIQRVNTGLVLINPAPHTKIKEGDKIIFIAEDDYSLPAATPDVPRPIQNELIIQNTPSLINTPRRVMILGWNLQGLTIIREMDNYVMRGSEVCIVADQVLEIQHDIEMMGGFKNITISYQQADITSRKALGYLQVHTFTNIMILSYSERFALQEADAVTLVTLMHLRDIKAQKQAQYSIVSEMLDIKNRTLAEVARPDDFIISDQVISLIMSQFAENKELKLVFDELFDAYGSEFYLKPAGLYVPIDTEVNFWTITEAALRRKETAVGYRISKKSGDADASYGVVLNPLKSDTLTLSAEDKIIVIAEDM